jgi:hypothetical protein
MRFPVRVFRSDVLGARSDYHRWACYLGNRHLFDVEATAIPGYAARVTVKNAKGGILATYGEVTDAPIPVALPVRHLYATAWGGADQSETGEPLTLCGLVKATVTTVHSSKARKTDCRDCRSILRARIKNARLSPMEGGYADERLRAADDNAAEEVLDEDDEPRPRGNMPRSFTGLTFTPGIGLQTWSRGKRS